MGEMTKLNKLLLLGELTKSGAEEQNFGRNDQIRC